MRGAPRKTSREAVLEKAQALFMTGGVASASIADIAAAAGVAKGTFYRYFESKEALVDALFLPEAQSLARLVANEGERPTVHGIASSLLAFFSDRPLFLSELRAAWRAASSYGFVAAARSSLEPAMRAYYRADPRHELSDLGTYSELVVGAVLDLCCYRIIEGRIDREAEALAMLEDLLKRFFDCEP